MVNICWIIKVQRICKIIQRRTWKLESSINSTKIVCIACNNLQFNNRNRKLQGQINQIQLMVETMMDQILILELIQKQTAKKNILLIPKLKHINNVQMLKEFCRIKMMMILEMNIPIPTVMTIVMRMMTSLMPIAVINKRQFQKNNHKSN